MELYRSPGNLEGSVSDKVLALNISVSKKQWQGENPNQQFTEAHALAFVQRAWRVAPKRANEADLILACAKDAEAEGYRKIEGVFKIGRDGHDEFIPSPWKKNGFDQKRCVFLGEPADSVACKKYLGKYLPPCKKGSSNPVSYIEDIELQEDEDVEFSY